MSEGERKRALSARFATLEGNGTLFALALGLYISFWFSLCGVSFLRIALFRNYPAFDVHRNCSILRSIYVTKTRGKVSII